MMYGVVEEYFQAFLLRNEIKVSDQLYAPVVLSQREVF
jgi:hypothetical protein